MPIRSASARLLAVALMAGVAFVAGPAPAVTPGEVSYGTKVFIKANDARARHGKASLKRSKCLQRFAARQAKKMAKQQKLSHSNYGPAISKCGLSAWAENVAYSPWGAPSVVKMWLKSSSHRKNLLGRYRITGVATRKGGGYWWSVQVFGRR